MTGSIRNKLICGLIVLLVMLGALAVSGLWGVYAYRGLVKGLRGRAVELPLAGQLARHLGDLRVSLAELSSGGWSLDPELSVPQGGWRGQDFELRISQAREVLRLYQLELPAAPVGGELDGGEFEREMAHQLAAGLDRVGERTQIRGWVLDAATVSALRTELDGLHTLAESLPSHLHRQLGTLSESVRSEYHAMLAVNWIAGAAAFGLLGAYLYLNYRWIFRPLSVLVAGSRRVAAGDYTYRVKLTSRDEMAELADALNLMTTNFQTIRDDLDRQVRERTKEVVRSEQLASVGFLAAGVAHEINNPLASIAMCAESLEGRLRDLKSELQVTTPDNAERDDDDAPAWCEPLDVATKYLEMIQTEAFRCKEITGKLLDFSRLGNTRRELTDLRQLVRQVVDMVGHLGKYQDRRIEFPAPNAGDPPVLAEVTATEIKQVVLNLVTNALDSLEPGGRLQIAVTAEHGYAELVFNDDGCGMTTETLTHLFEPFFTRKKHGQGTGLGLSITYRIVADHGGQIIAHSAGPGRGSRFTVTLPLHAAHESVAPRLQKESSHRRQAA